MPSIIFLGTGGDEYVVGKQLKGSGGIIVRVEGYQFHIDPGPAATSLPIHIRSEASSTMSASGMRVGYFSR